MPTDPKSARDNDFSAQQQVSDPLTGTTMAGPLEPGSGRPGSNWGLAARWLAFAFLLILAALLVAWMF